MGGRVRGKNTIQVDETTTGWTDAEGGHGSNEESVGIRSANSLGDLQLVGKKVGKEQVIMMGDKEGAYMGQEWTAEPLMSRVRRLENQTLET